MIYLLDVIACSLVVIAEVIGSLLFAILTQFIFYKVFKINLFKSIIKGLDNLDRRLSEIF